VSPLRLVAAWLGGLLLLGLAVLVAVSSLPWRPLWLYSCAFAEAGLVLGCFVELGRSSPLVRLFALGTPFWFVLMFGLTLLDLFSR
jgi:hypothetical protein